MKLTTEQQGAVDELYDATAELEAIREKHKAEMYWATRDHQTVQMELARQAIDLGVPKRQLQSATGIKGTTHFYQFLKEAGVKVSEKPQHLNKDG